MKNILKVTNRSTDQVVYNLPELHMRRVFTPGEVKEIPEKELRTLNQADGGAILVKHYLKVDDKAWVDENLPNAPIEYFWDLDDIKRCILEDSVELFEETLEFAPLGVIDTIKDLAWKLPMTDMNKIQVLKEKTGFDTLAAIAVMKPAEGTQETSTPTKRERLRRREA